MKAAASADVSISPTTGLTAQLSPTTQVLPIPGTASFLLLVNNTGNSEDSYTAVITGTNGPVTASLMGLDGNPTQSIPLFRLPGLSTGAILIETNLTTLGQGKVFVQVTSLNHATMTASETATVSAALVATTTQLMAIPSPATVGQAVTFTALVAPSSGTGTPMGTVTFAIDGKAQPPVGVSVTNGKVQATFTTSTLTQGQHAITASYSGNAQFASSTSNAVDEIVAPAQVDGPQITAVLRYGIHWMPTTLVLTFNQPLDPIRAQDVNNYIIIDPNGHRVALLSAMYNPRTQTVTLHPARRMNFHNGYKLTVNGASPNGLTDSQGLPLDGKGDGTPGSSYVTVVNRHNLVWGSATPKVSKHISTSLISKSTSRPSHPPGHGKVVVLRSGLMQDDHVSHSIHLGGATAQKFSAIKPALANK